MKRVIFAIIVLTASPVWALTFMGPPTSNIKEGQFGIAGEYGFSEMDIRLEGYGLSATTDIETNAYFARLIYGMTDNAELFARLGVSDFEEDVSNGFESGTEFAWGLGAKVKLAGAGNVSSGISFQLASLSGDDSAIVGPYLVEGDVDAYEIQVATGAALDADNLCIYAGPFLHLITGDLDASVGGIDVSVDIEQESEFGGYAGFGLKIAETSTVNVEYQFTGDADAIGISLMHRFGGPAEAKKRTVKEWPKTDASGRKVKGYRGRVDPATGKMKTTPVYEDER
jgi:hypothetical protein